MKYKTVIRFLNPWRVVFVTLFLVIVNLFITTPSFAGNWTLVGLNNFQEQVVTVDPTNNNVLYAGTNGGGIFKSTDGGANWIAINNGIPNPSGGVVYIIVVDPTNSNMLYAGGAELGTPTGLFKSTDGGANWTTATNGIVDVGYGAPPAYVNSIAMDPNNHSTLYAALGVHCGAVYKSTDGAANWTRTGAACDPVSVRIDPSNSNILYAGKDLGTWRSEDAGANWTQTSSFDDHYGALTIDPFSTTHLYASNANGVYKSTDSSTTWTLLTSSPNNIYKGLLADPLRPNTVYAGKGINNANGVYMTTDAGVTWTSISTGLPNTLADITLTLPVNNHDVLYAATNQGIYSYNLPPLPIINIAASPSSANVTANTPFNVNVKVNDSGQAFNAAQATVTLSANLRVNGINAPKTNGCNFNYTKVPTTSDPSFAGSIFNSSSTGCTVYTMTVIPTTVGNGTITFNNASIKAYADASEILTGVQNGSYTIAAPTPTPTPPGTTLVTVDDSVQGTSQNQWNYVGNGWSHCADTSNPACNPNLYNNSVSWDNTTNDYATLTFTGIRVSLYGLVDPNHGIAGVSIDNGSETNVDFYSATRTGNVLLWTSPILAPGQHTIKVRVTGNKNSNSGGAWLALDRADLLQTTPSGLTDTNSTFNTYGPTFTLTGTKDSSIVHIFVNGSETGVTYPTSTTWQAVESVSLGNNDFVIYGTDANNVQTSSINVTVNMHTLGDINGDGVVDLTDASLFAVDWGKTSNLTYPLSDMNSDGSVNLTDFSILAKLEQ